MYHSITRYSLITLIVGMLAATSGFAVTKRSPASDEESIAVSFADLDLSTQHGLNTLYERLESAAAQACHRDHGRQPLSVYRHGKQCVNRALDSAVDALGQPALQDLHDS